MEYRKERLEKFCFEILALLPTALPGGDSGLVLSEATLATARWFGGDGGTVDGDDSV